MGKKKIVIFASGSGTNAENIILKFANTDSVKVVAVFCNNPKAGVIERAKKLNTPLELFDKAQFNDEVYFSELLKRYEADLIVLAGFLWLIPAYLVKKYNNRIINIHPALLPKYGGKGMYGHHVHEAVMAAKENEHGITIHFVNEQYDEGNIIFQAKFPIQQSDTINDVSKNISKLEMQYYPEAIARILQV
jgi:phosphoribosylglycinamide formyltransferase-1